MAGINFDFTTGSLPAGITFARASIGTYTNNAGTLITAGNDVARFNYIAGVSNLLIEPSATNLALQSNGFSTTWALNSGSLTPAQFVSPDGASNGWAFNDGNNQGWLLQTLTFATVPYTLSIWVKKISGTSTTLQLYFPGGTGTPLSISTTLARLFIVATSTASGSSTIGYRQQTSDGSVVGIFGAQFETGSIMTSYIPTTTAAVTRAADSATFTIPSGVNALKYTFDDNSTQVVNVSPGSYTIPTNLSRANIKSIVSVFGYDFTSGSLPTGMTFSRASIGTYTNAAGTLITAGNDVARMNYVGGVSCLLVEPSATNLLLQSNSFSTAPWTLADSAVIAAAQFTSPDGTNNGWSVTSGAATGFSGVLQGGIAFAAVSYTESCWSKFITGTAPVRAVIDGGPNFNLSTTATLIRSSVTATAIAAPGNGLFSVNGASGNIDGIYGAQLELGSVMTSYIPTTTAPVTRAPDFATFTIPAGINQLTFTFDNNSTQNVAITPGSYTIPTNLARPNIKSVTGQWAYDFTSGSLPADITFTRGSIGTYTNASNVLITAGNDVARFNYISGVANLLIEGSATNLLLQSNNFSNAAWTLGGGATVSASQFVSPDGTNNGWTLVSSVTDGFIYQAYTYTSIPYTVSIWAKQVAGPGVPQIKISTASSGPLAISAALTRFSFTATPPVLIYHASFQVIGGAGTDGIYGMQLETGSVPTSYIPTTTAQVTRAADQATFTIPSGINLLTYTFDDNSKQAVPVSPGPYTVPTTLSRANIKSIVGTTVPPPNFDFSTGVLPAGITFTRASIGTYVNATGTLITAGNDVARFNYASGVSNLLIEGSATNLLGQSNNFSDVSWAVFNGAVVTAAQFVSPDGTNNGWKLSNGAANQGMIEKLFTFSGTTYTMSAWAKQITGTPSLLLSVYGATWVSAPITTTLARYSTINVNSTQGKGEISVFNSILGNAIGIYGVQLETGSVMTSYIPTTTAAVTRQADSATFIIPLGINQLVYTFDDGSTQTVAVTPGSYTIPTTLARPNIKSIQGRYAFDFTSGSLPAGMTFTRPSIGTYANAGGTLITAGNDVARFNYVGGVSNLLIEPSATNLVIDSNGFGSWSVLSAPIVTAAQFVSPDGSNNGWSLGSSGPPGIVTRSTITVIAAPYTMSVWGKFITGTSPISFYIPYATKGTAITSSSLQRLSITATPSQAGSASNAGVEITGGAGTVDGIYGCQMEFGSVMTSYIPTTTAAVTRAADAAVLTIPPGVNALLYTFDDGSTQQVSVTPGSYTIPVNLSRPNIKSIQGLSGFDFTTGTLPAGITFTRASIGTYFDGGNILRTASNNVARMNYVSGVSCLLIEGSATNQLTQSNNFSDAIWFTGNGCVVTAAQFISPDGTNNGWSITSGTTNGYIQELYTYLNAPYTLSVWAKQITGSAPIRLTVGSVVSGSFATTTTITRLSFSGTSTAGVLGPVIQVLTAPGSTAGIYGVQQEAGSVMTSYIPTTTTAVTRAVDQATFTIPTGVTQLTYTFDDNSTQTVSATPGSYTIPTTLSRPNIKSIAWVTQTTFGAIITLQCAKCGFYMKTTNPHDSTIIAAKHTAGWGPTHIVSVT